MRGHDHIDRFLDLYNGTYSRLVAYCRRRTRTAADADDAVADTYLVAWRRLDDVLGADSPIAWLYGVAYRVLSNQRRSTERSNRLTQRLRLQPPPMLAIGPADAAAKNEDVVAVYSALAELDSKDQELIRLAAFEELSHAEIGAVIGIRPATVRSRLFRARRRLQQNLTATGRNIDADTETSQSTGPAADSPTLTNRGQQS